jgi:putative drug exporter of the RND superfamily
LDPGGSSGRRQEEELVTGWLYRVGRWTALHRRRVVVVWVVAVAALIGLGQNVGGEFSEEFGIPGTESYEAQELLQERFVEQSGGSARVVFHSAEGTLADPDNAAAVEATLGSVRDLETVSVVGDPLAGRGGAVAADGTIAFADVRYRLPIGELGSDSVDELDEAVEVGRDLGLQVELSGELPSYYQSPHIGGAELAFKVGAALLIMLLAFGSIIATGLPLGLALFGLAAGAGLIRLLAAVVDVPSSSLLLGVMLGLGAGIDYALFIVTRHRQNLAEGADVLDSIGRANATAGQAVIFAGGTVIIAIGGLVVAGIPAATIMGASAAIVVAIMVLASVTLLPSLLGFAGEGIDRLRLPGMKARVEAGANNFWGRWARHVAERPWRYLAASVLVLGLLAVPVFDMRLAMPDASTASEEETRRQAHELLVEGFGAGFSGPLVLTIDLPSENPEPTLAALGEAIAADEQVAQVSPAMPNEAGDTAVMQITPVTGPSEQETEDLVHRLREGTIPQTLAGTDAAAYVGGITASNIDLTDRASERLPWFIATVIALSLLLLMMVFRSVWVPIKAAAMNVLSIGAGYGAVVAVFQWEWFGGLFGLDGPVPVVSMVPMLMFAILFGLSMDYEVFLLSRTREEYLRSGDNTDSVVAGISNTARVITSAALIMIVVFTGFALGDNIIIQQIGLGLAVAVLIDATIVRVALVPSTMVLLGDRNWWMPRWLDRLLPHLDIEGEAGLPDPDAVDDPAEIAGGLLLLMLVRQIEQDAAKVDGGGAPSRLLTAAAALGSRTDVGSVAPEVLTARARRTAYGQLAPLAATVLGENPGPGRAARPPGEGSDPGPMAPTEPPNGAAGTVHPPASTTATTPTERNDRADP